ncbi:RNA-binding protein [Methanosarcinales archaeon ex4484_138]|nr:MAG: RNA-binding protein [Methanosarcinales archaeon ex4484_138]RLG25582.1 MAG: RNA-binding protein [Methanosarcinales archaeon]RLG27801.1 MAG: RNA-binding protein [Methanosarcinales archaeon]
MRPKARHRLKKSEVRRIVDRIKENIGLDITPLIGSETVEVAEFTDHTILLVDGAASFFEPEDGFFIPTLRGVMKFEIRGKRVVVDVGAVRFIVNGADVMGPGIVEADEDIETDDIVVVVDERHGKPLAIGRALKTSGDMRSRGKAVKSLHYVGDKIWNLEL